MAVVCDGSFKSGIAASASVLINESGVIMDGIARRVQASLALVTEALAVRNAC
ncbi:hypothetical protein LguiB_020189 [Lonicera macranthoides]